MKNIGAVRLYDSQFSTIKIIFSRTITSGITIQRGYQCLIQNNKITTNRKSQELIGDGVHVWSSAEIWIKTKLYFWSQRRHLLRKNQQHLCFRNISEK